MNLKHVVTKFDATTVKEDGTFIGYGSIFGNIDKGGDIVEKGAFSASLKDRGANGVKLLWQHDPSQPIGIWSDICEDNKGLLATGQLALNTTKGREAYELMKMGAVDGLSIGFRTKIDQYDRTTGIRKLKEVDLREISVVTFPMNEQATIAAVKADEMTEREFERLLRDAGLSREFAKRITLHGFKAARESIARDQRDAGEGGNTADLLAAINRAQRALLS